MAANREQAGALAWSGYVSRVHLRQRYESDGFPGPESQRLMVVAREEPVGFVFWLKVSHGPPPSRCWNVGIGLRPDHQN
jgi:hypothetical protein